MTYSLVAHDPATGELGLAVQSHWFSVGSIVPHVVLGVGAVATQSVAGPDQGERILEALEDGASPDAALDAVLRDDEAAAFRQVAVVDARGRVAAHTGAQCLAAAGHTTGEGWSAQANIMRSAEVWPAMAEAFAAADGPLPERLLAALEAAQAAGGDVRGQQSAALVVLGEAGAVDLRVEDHPEPLAELRRLLVLHRAYAAAEDGDEAMAEGRLDDAREAFERAAELAPGNAELLFWAGLSAAQGGDLDAGVARVREAIAANPGLGVLLDRLGDDLVPAAPAVRAALG
jgi:uncharacterized Ntn-hydrolase superfamily protein